MITVVVPCFNEQDVLPFLFERLTKAAESWNIEWEVICVDDGSTDRTWEILRKYQQENSHWKGLLFSRNFGHQTAVSAGIFHASGKAIIVMDADLQDPPEQLHLFIEKWKEGYDVVFAIRRNRKENVVLRICYSLFYRLFSRIVQFDVPLDSGDFCIMSRRMVDALNEMPERNRFIRGLRAWVGFKQIGIVYERNARVAGKSKYTVTKLVKLALDGMISFSAFPLKLASHIGFYVSLISMVGVLFTLIQRIFSTQFAAIGIAPVPGFATIVMSILFLGGVQLIFLGVIGEYLYRIFDEVKCRPHWIVQDVCGIEEKPKDRAA